MFQFPISNIQYPISNIQYLISNIQYPIANFQVQEESWSRYFDESKRQLAKKSKRTKLQVASSKFKVQSSKFKYPISNFQVPGSNFQVQEESCSRYFDESKMQLAKKVTSKTQKSIGAHLIPPAFHCGGQASDLSAWQTACLTASSRQGRCALPTTFDFKLAHASESKTRANYVLNC
jgi:hypothetical protein